jgi:hypothetical protein
VSDIDNDKSLPATDEQFREFLLNTISTYSERSMQDVKNLDRMVRLVFKLKQIPNMYGDVAKFVDACGQVGNEDNFKLYNKLITEEFEEFQEAYANNDSIEELDACMDMIWVILGYCHVKGWDVHGAWNEVARSNLTKIDAESGKVLKREDGKVLKPEGWSPPDLSNFV